MTPGIRRLGYVPADALPKIARPQAQFVSILGSLTRRSTANPFDVIYRLAERTGGAGQRLAGRGPQPGQRG